MYKMIINKIASIVYKFENIKYLSEIGQMFHIKNGAIKFFIQHQILVENLIFTQNIIIHITLRSQGNTSPLPCLSYYKYEAINRNGKAGPALGWGSKELGSEWWCLTKKLQQRASSHMHADIQAGVLEGSKSAHAYSWLYWKAMEFLQQFHHLIS